MHSSDDVSLCPGSSVFKTFARNMLFHAIIGTGKKNFLKQFLPTFSCKIIFVCNNSDQTYFSDTLTSAGPLGRCWTGFNTSLRDQQMFTHRKSCLIPILKTSCDNNYNFDTFIIDLKWIYILLQTGCYENQSADLYTTSLSFFFHLLTSEQIRPVAGQDSSPEISLLLSEAF